ncbi:Phage head morphogenesis domain containing protein [uncultured Caudovirales phage]|uniref:Phage head morphogenesis domain containing protein n=1 Tax=uncultured Caudovirales phage TaxID=2100421 RepID=A0A6J5QQF9_9CAUD|nr:Phage head morphogenesis domain containing protein [uncultured Caudovirales phage]CAB4203778.1 Phage head morphogenesis domain containing protein [uncultured Caudovirales phage]CAB4215315.1 Phage head morphogenesis domain containing protein [uncultured Caudovirales phage]CAB5230224.1 Phage head morphogenesis domain containing protein [uncultured Caudovirales phage]
MVNVHAKSCPCKTCKSAKPPLWWIDFNAEKQIITKDGITDTFEATEARAVRAFASGIQDDIDKVLEEVARQLTVSIRTGNLVTYRQLEQVQAALKASQKKLIDDLANTAKPYAQTIAQAGFSYGTSLLPDGSFDLNLLSGKASEFVVAATNRAAIRMAQSVSETLAEKVAQIIRIGIEETATGTDVMAMLEEAGFDENRAQTIARTESARAYTDGQNAAWEASGVVKGKTWLISPYACEFCEAAAEEYGEKSIGVNDSFYERGAIVTGESGATITLDFDDTSGPPLHPNCRCGLLPVIDYDAVPTTGRWQESEG